MLRIATLVPSATDLVAALGLEEALVGVSHECDHPAARGKPVVTAPRVRSAPASDPGEVDAEVRAALAAGDSLYVADRATLAELEPSVVVGQAVCDVCAVTEAEAGRALPRGARLVTLDGTSVAGLRSDLARLGAVTGRAVEADLRARAIDATLDALPAPSRRRRVVTLEWSAPLFLGGHWVPELVERSGGRHPLGESGSPSRTTSAEAVRGAAPELLVFMPCGYDLEAAASEARASRVLRGLAEATGAELWATDATRLFSRLTPDAVELGARTLSAILRAERPPPGTALRIDPAA